ncbi:MAG TPA: Na/Pi cotransporter family protein [Falsiroseomonas sp.]|jgi:phosphate:Na+ symporter|nr:Na/Pi cotransporter family protein [Falsiroseomonas sp.]
MTELRLLVQLAGEAALLLWGLHMVQSGVERAFGGKLQALLATRLGRPSRAMLAGLGVTAALQSSTATALMIASFAAAGAVALVPALAAMLGANIGTALIVQLLSFDVGWLSPLLILSGVVAFRTGAQARTRDLGRVAIGLGLMLLALHLLVQTLAPVESSPMLGQVLAALADAPVPNLLIAAAIAWAAHSSIAGVLFVATLAGSGVLGAEAAIAMVAGANLGSALNPLLQSGSRAGQRARLRLPLGNLVNRVLGGVLALAFLPVVTGWMQALDPAPVRLVANAHLAFNLATSLLAFPLLRPLAWVLAHALPERPELDEAMPRYLDAGAASMPSVAMVNARREVLRIADVLERMLDASARAFTEEQRDCAKALATMDDVVDRLHRAVLAYLAAIPAEKLADADAERIAEIQAFAIALEHAADVLSRDVARHATKRLRRGVTLAAEDRDDLAALHERLLEELRLAVAVFMVEDAEAARRLVRTKERMRVTEREAARRAALAAPLPLGEPGATPGLVLDAIRDLRRVGAHLAAVAHPLLERRGELLSSRLAPQRAAKG